jgi:hypothetical protein
MTIQERAFNVEARKVGGMTFLKLGRLTISFSVSPEYRPLGSNAAAKAARKEAAKARLSRRLHLTFIRGLRAARYLQA